MKTMIGLVASLGLAAVAATATAQDYSADPSFGSVTLSAGFTPDPHSRNLTAGGSIRAQDRFSTCRGYIANAPDYSVYYTAGSTFPLIFSVDSDRDTTLVINGPDTRWYCDDDGGEGVNPLVRFGSPQSGRYDTGSAPIRVAPMCQQRCLSQSLAATHVRLEAQIFTLQTTIMTLRMVLFGRVRSRPPIFRFQLVTAIAPSVAASCPIPGQWM